MLHTRLTKALGLKHPIIQAPMAYAAGGKLAAAVTNAGGLGFIGGGYGDGPWLEQQFREAGNQRVGCGFITWSLKNHPELLDQVLEHAPSAVFLSFGDPQQFIDKIKHTAAATTIICQVQSLRDARHAMDCGADVIVAQGAEAGGHGEKRSTMTLVPEIADAIAAHSPQTLLCAAGGIGDGRGLAASLMLGADGVVVGSRFWASHEALVHPNLLQRAVESSGDNTLRTTVIDHTRKLDWPERYNIRVMRNSYTDQWHKDIVGLKRVIDVESERWGEALAAGDADVANPIVGEVTGLIHSVEPAEKILLDMVDQAELLMGVDWVSGT